MTQMIEVTVAEATGAALDWMVAKAANLPVIIDLECCGSGVQSSYASPPECCGDPVYAVFLLNGKRFSPANDCPGIDGQRHYVALELGDKVMVPDELISKPDPN